MGSPFFMQKKGLEQIQYKVLGSDYNTNETKEHTK